MSSTRRSHPPAPAVLAVFAVVLALLLVGCSGGADTMSEDGGGGGGVVGAQGGGSAPGGAGDEAGSGEGPSVGIVDVDVAAAGEPRRIRRGSVTVEVDDLTKAAGQVRDVTDALQGYVSDESIGLSSPSATYSDGFGDDFVAPPVLSGPGEARIVVRVPQASMLEVMDAFAQLGVELGRWSTETEVETALVDLESRIATQSASVDRVRALLGEATSLSDVVQLESELSEREADLESVTAQQQALTGRAAMATVTAVLRTAEVTDTADGNGFLAGLASGWDALTASTVVLLTVLGALFPFVVVAATVAVPLVVWRRRVRRDRLALTAP